VPRMKKNLATRWGWALACGLVGLWAQAAHAAEPRLLLVEPPGPASGLLTALQIQLTGLAAPERVVQPLAASAADQIQAGSSLARSRHALASVWIDPPLSRPSGVVMLYVVGEREGRALIEVVRVPGERGPALERTLALKVREVVAELRRAPRSAPAATQLQVPRPAPPTAASEPVGAPPPPPAPQSAEAAAVPPPPSAARWSGFLGLGPRLGSQPRLGLSRWGFGLGAGPALTLRAWRFAGLLSADWLPVRRSERSQDRVRFWELDAALMMQVQRNLGPIWLGARIGPQLIYLDASGTTGLGETGQPYNRLIWGMAFGVDAEWPLARAFGLAADLQLQTLASHERFTVNGYELVDAGRLRVRMGLSLVLRP
jgi:hypothetical protein